MEDYKTLIELGKNEEVLKLTENKNDSNSLIYRAYALSLLEKDEDFNKLISENKKLLEKEQLPLLIYIHLDHLLSLQKFDEAETALNHYFELDYYSQEVEEMMADYKKEIFSLKAKANIKNSDPTPNEVIAYLRSEDANKVASMFPFLLKEEINIGYYMPAIQDVLLNFPKQSVRSTMLLVLNERSFDKEVEFNHLGKIIKIIPSQIERIENEEYFKKVEEKLYPFANKDSTILEIGKALIGQYTLNNYPFLVDFNDEHFFKVVASISNKMLMATSNELDTYTSEEKGILDIANDVNKNN